MPADVVASHPKAVGAGARGIAAGVTGGAEDALTREMERELEAIEAERESTDAPPRAISTPTDRRGRRGARARGTHRGGFSARVPQQLLTPNRTPFPPPSISRAVEKRIAAMRQAADDFAAKLQKTIRVQLIKIPKKVRRRVRARPARRRASHFVTSPVRRFRADPPPTPPQVRVLSLKQFSEDFGRDVSKELLADINLRAGLPADANGAEATTADETVRPPPRRRRPPETDARFFPLSTPPACRRVSAAFRAPRARPTPLLRLKR